MSTPSYRVTLSFDNERKVFIARAPELAHCHGEDESVNYPRYNIFS